MEAVAGRLAGSCRGLFHKPVRDARVAQWQRSRLVIGRLVGSNPLSGWAGGQDKRALGGMPERLIGTDCKSVALTGYAGSNPAPSTIVTNPMTGLDISLG